MDISDDVLEILVDTMRWGEAAIGMMSTTSIRMYAALHGSARRPGRPVVQLEPDGQISWLWGLVPCQTPREDDACVRDLGPYTVEEWTAALREVAWGVRHAQQRGVLKIKASRTWWCRGEPIDASVAAKTFGPDQVPEQLLFDVISGLEDLWGFEAVCRSGDVTVGAAAAAPHISILRLCDTTFMDKDVLDHTLPLLTELRELDMRGGRIVPQAGGWGQQLTRLMVHGSGNMHSRAYGPPRRTWCPVIACLPRLTHLELRGREDGPALIEALAQLPLRDLRLHQSGIALSMLADLQQVQTLEVLDLRGAEGFGFGSSEADNDDGSKVLVQALARLPRLRFVCLENICSSQLPHVALAGLPGVRVLVDEQEGGWYSTTGEFDTFVGTTDAAAKTLNEVRSDWAPMPPPQDFQKRNFFYHP